MKLGGCMTYVSRTFSTAGMPAHETLSAWRDYMAQVYYSVDIKPRDLRQVRGELHEAAMGPIGLSHFKADEQRVFRHARAAQYDHAENFVFIFPLKERLYFRQRDRSGFIAPGGVVLLNSSEAYEASCPDGFENLTLKIPCLVLREGLPQIDSLCAHTGIANPTLAAAISRVALPLLKPDVPWTPSQAGRLSEHLLDFLHMMIETAPHFAQNGSWRRPMPGMLQKLKMFMLENLGDHELSPGVVAAAQGISIRHLHKLFASVGTTFGQVLMNLRLDEAQRLIKSPAHRGMTLQQIAFDCGFSNQSHFSTCYRARFGVRPRETRGMS
jgi:AraC family transcriptional regulator, positive regulator of tynA and feaB